MKSLGVGEPAERKGVLLVFLGEEQVAGIATVLGRGQSVSFFVICVIRAGTARHGGEAFQILYKN